MNVHSELDRLAEDARRPELLGVSWFADLATGNGEARDMQAGLRAALTVASADNALEALRSEQRASEHHARQEARKVAEQREHRRFETEAQRYRRDRMSRETATIRRWTGRETTRVVGLGILVGVAAGTLPAALLAAVGLAAFGGTGGPDHWRNVFWSVFVFCELTAVAIALAVNSRRLQEEKRLQVRDLERAWARGARRL